MKDLAQNNLKALVSVMLKNMFNSASQVPLAWGHNGECVLRATAALLQSPGTE